MLFNSLDFAIFLPIVFLLYWALADRGLRTQNLLLLAASYYFYACWDWRFLFLLLFSTLLDYVSGLRIASARTAWTKRAWFWTSIGVNLGFLGLFKYYDFFIVSFIEMLSVVGIRAHAPTLGIILPVGISFYTFHGLSYVIDVYKDRIRPERGLVDYALFVSFFPLLVAGPIERATHLLPQLKRARTFDPVKAVDGLRQILWGLFKKIVIADQCAKVVDVLFDQYEIHGGASLFLGALFFAFQIYGDFSGYSDIAIGTARLFGVELLRNFAYPYFSRDIAEFWRRWHISLSSWFRDYLYIPLGGSKGTLWSRVRNTFIVFLVSGLWHGANWTFVVWGALNAIYFLPLLLTDRNRTNLDTVAQGRTLPSMRELLAMGGTFGLTLIAWVFFRADNVRHATGYLARMFSNPASYFDHARYAPHLLLLTGIAVLLVAEWRAREQRHALEAFGLRWARPVRWSFYGALAVTVLLFSGGEETFIYFQF